MNEKKDNAKDGARSRAGNLHAWIAGVMVVALVVFALVSFMELQRVKKDLSFLQEKVTELSSSSSPSVMQESNFTSVTVEMPIVAVSNAGDGALGKLTVKIIPGNNNVLISTNPFLEPDLQYSANKAVTYAKMQTNLGAGSDYIFSYDAGQAKLLGGESAGAAATIATISALTGKRIKSDTVITGTINPDGTVGMVGGIIEKAKAASDAGYRIFLVPEGQSKITYYEQQVTSQPYHGFRLLNTQYVPKTVDLADEAKKEWGLTIKEVRTIDEAVPLLLK